jgi:hypothetical protein
MAIDQGVEIGKITFEIFLYSALTITRSVSISNEELCLGRLFIHTIIAFTHSSHFILHKCHITADGEFLFS